MNITNLSGDVARIESSEIDSRARPNAPIVIRPIATADAMLFRLPDLALPQAQAARQDDARTLADEAGPAMRIAPVNRPPRRTILGHLMANGSLTQHLATTRNPHITTETSSTLKADGG